MSDQCSWSFTDPRNENIIACAVHKGERELLKPATRRQTLTQLVNQGKWGGRAFREGEIEAMSEQTQTTEQHQALSTTTMPQVPSTKPANGGDLVEYATPSGQQIAVSIKMFQEMICPAANASQARYMMNWCAYNRIDVFANEAYFSIMDNKPVIMVSKDCWLRRAERHPMFVGYEAGILVELSMNELKSAVIGGTGDDYLFPQPIKDRLLADAIEGRVSDPKGMPSRLTVRKRGQFLADNENLKGGWIEITRKDRPHPILFQINKDGWEVKKEGKDNIFWREKAAFMIFKSALKNGMRLAFPELSGLIAQKDVEDFDAAGAADYELKQHEVRTALIRELHAAGAKVPGPTGPFTHDLLHDLAGALYDGRGIAELSTAELSALITQVTTAQTDREAKNDLSAIIVGFREGKGTIETTGGEPERDEPGDFDREYEQPVDVDPETGELLPVA